MKTPWLVPFLASILCACGADTDSRTLDQLSNDEYVAECDAVRRDSGAAALDGLQRYSCYFGAMIGGSCNPTVFANCISLAPSPCAAPGADDPVRTCAATVEEARACLISLAAQYETYQATTCAAPPTSSPTPAKAHPACDSLCKQCPSYDGCL